MLRKHQVGIWPLVALVLLGQGAAAAQGIDAEEAFSSENDQLVTVSFKQRNHSIATVSLKNGSRFIVSSAFIGCSVKADGGVADTKSERWHFVDIFESRTGKRLNLLPGQTVSREIKTDGKQIRICSTGTLMGYQKIGALKTPPKIDYSSAFGKGDDSITDEIKERNACHTAIKSFMKFDPLIPHEINTSNIKGVYDVEWIASGQARSARLKCIYSQLVTKVGYYNR